jgi:hypothetical protein
MNQRGVGRTRMPTAVQAADAKRSAVDAPLPFLDIARRNDNELVLFDHQARVSWIVYPPRSQYDFIRRPSRDTVIVEYHPWTPFSETEEHTILPREGCGAHGLACGANRAIQAGIDCGWNPFG